MHSKLVLFFNISWSITGKIVVKHWLFDGQPQENPEFLIILIIFSKKKTF